MSSIADAPTRARRSRERCPSSARGSTDSSTDSHADPSVDPSADTASGTPLTIRERALQHWLLRGSHNGAVAGSETQPDRPGPVGTPRGGARRAAKPKRTLQPKDAATVDIAALYWHFVDVVWIAIFTLIYLIQ